MDKTTFFGTCFAVASMLIGLKLGGGMISSFVDFPSVFVVFGGAFGTIAIAYNYDRVRDMFLMMKEVYVAPHDYDYLKIISNILSAADVARKEGILALDSKLNEIENPFLQRGLQLVVDGVDVNIIEDIFSTEIDSRDARHADVKSTIDFLASIAPAFGLIGTILGLVGLLRNMDDPTSIGPNMALALVTTFYGAVAANMFLLPFAKKVEARSNDETMFYEIMSKGCLLIAAGIHPRIIQERLLSHLNEKSRAAFNEFHLSEELKKDGQI